ncbi:MAG: NYN domain-containing protein [bacterium]
MTGKARVALLIDGDNVSPKAAEQMLDAAEGHGRLTIRRIYGDWSSPNLRSWRDVLPGLGLQPVHQMTYIAGKNATDIGLVIDAMDLLHRRQADVFCIASSDSDFAPLALRIREEGHRVIGFGAQTTPAALIGACDEFHYLDRRDGAPSAEPTAPGTPPAAAPATSSPDAFSAEEAERRRADATLRAEGLERLQRAFASCAAPDGELLMTSLGNKLAERYGAVDSRRFGYSGLKKWVESHGEVFQVEPHPTKNLAHIVRRAPR